jgi:hypothetical protein
MRRPPSKTLPIPAPPNMDFDNLCADVIAVESNINRHRRLLEEAENKLTKTFSELLATGKKS